MVKKELPDIYRLAEGGEDVSDSLFSMDGEWTSLFNFLERSGCFDYLEFKWNSPPRAYL